MADEDNVLYVRSNGNKNVGTVADDVWDDTALIKAYDKAVTLAKEEIRKRIGMDVQDKQGKQKSTNFKQSRQTKKPYKKWTVNSPCRAVYSEDGKTYEAIIYKIYEKTGTCVVRFIGYGNTEKVELSSLLESEGLVRQATQQEEALAEKRRQVSSKQTQPCINSKIKNAVGEKMDYDGEDVKCLKNPLLLGASFNSAFGIMPPPPPLPPQLMANLPENDADALSSMLMSWYISGFHTGYYHGLKHAKDNQGRKKDF